MQHLTIHEKCFANIRKVLPTQLKFGGSSSYAIEHQKTGLEMLQALEQLHSLKQDGLLNSPEAKKLKEKILSGN